MSSVGKVANGSEDTQCELISVENNDAGVAGITNLSRLMKRNPLHSLVMLATPGWEILWFWLWVVVLGAPTV